ncbi:MAG: ABC transporter permease [Candidatus Krumholzibacteria bacterium]|jgi:phospholipid/cholesterol/gamma-HCH transport system permease protein|nr:ABC transporter permease [Candidatus Krumholzibacteria bacterium]MDP6669515.1 ABC transporter permease [Candidatus Krumholzibacteria bacterium]MDP6797837.1 ABC transporter permease [Candidatus Krumholzibacteria bacterium]MDP7022515.1 ABC transporter permease [Candidatus Krumholzibacteria bacterium]
MRPLKQTSLFFGRKIFLWIEELGAGSLLLAQIFRYTPRFQFSGNVLAQQMLEIGNRSMPLVVVVSLFSGAVTAVQASYQFEAYVPLILLGSTVYRSVVIELGPVLTGLVVGGRVSAAIAAEIGTMKVTEQVDALEAMAIPPVRYLVLPRFWAGVVMLPVITAIADLLAVGGAWAVSLLTVPRMTHHLFIEGIRLHFYPHDFFAGLLKSLFFGMIITASGSYFGLKASGGAEGVGKAAMQAVVASCLLILVLDYFLATVLFQVLFEGGL